MQIILTYFSNGLLKEHLKKKYQKHAIGFKKINLSQSLAKEKFAPKQ